MSEELNEAAIEVATGPKSVTNDGQTVVAQSIDEIKKAAQFVASDSATARPHFGLRFSKLVPPGCG